MCLAIPGRILSIEGEDLAFRIAQVDFCGVQKSVNLAYIPEALTGDFILAHVGFAVSRITAEDAGRIHESLRICKEVSHALSGN